MKKEDKNAVIEQLQATLSEYAHFYLTDIAGLDAARTSALRRLCYNRDVKLVVVKNTLLRKALEMNNAGVDFTPIFESLKGETSLMLSNTGNAPAKLIKEFIGKDKDAKPRLKAAYVEDTFFVGANQLDVLAQLKSKNELIGDLVALLQSPAKNVVSALQSGANTIHGVLKTLGERK